MEIEYKIIVEMAKEIGDLRANLDSEYGEYHKENYKVKNIIEEYYNYCNNNYKLEELLNKIYE